MSQLVITRVFDAPIQQVWHAWIDAETMKKWWGPATFTSPFVSIDFRVGGKYLSCMHGAPGPGMPEQDFWSTGEYKEIVPMKKFVATDHFSDKDGNIISPNSVGMPGKWDEDMILTVEFEEMGDKTKVTITHTGHPEEMMQNATMGWNQSLDKMEQVLKA